jgi:membrane protein DedA with SNARE-associated domain
VLTALTVALIAGSLLGAGWTAFFAARDRRADNRLLIELIVVEILVLAQLVVAVVAVARGHRPDGPDGPDGPATFLAYAAGETVLLPAGVFWSQAERSRSSTLVITVACLGVAVMTGRMIQIWGGFGG